MLCFEVTRNGERLATAGLRGKGLLMLTFDHELSVPTAEEKTPTFSLGALDATTEPNTSLNWVDGPVRLGDEFVVRFILCEAADEPRRLPHRALSPLEARRRRVRYLRHLETEAKKVRAELDLKEPTKNTRKPRMRGSRATRSPRRA